MVFTHPSHKRNRCVDQVVGRITAGVNPDSVEVSTGKCAYITTGSKLPRGADAVVKVREGLPTPHVMSGRNYFSDIICPHPGKGQRTPRPTNGPAAAHVLSKQASRDLQMRSGATNVGPAYHSRRVHFSASGLGAVACCSIRVVFRNGLEQFLKPVVNQLVCCGGYGTRACVFRPPFVQHAARRTALLLSAHARVLPAEILSIFVP